MKREVREIERMEQEVARLRSEMESLQRQLAHVQHKQQQLLSATSSGATAGAAAGASSGVGAERKQRIEALLLLKSASLPWPSLLLLTLCLLLSACGSRPVASMPKAPEQKP